MITDRVIKEIYRKYNKEVKNPEDLKLDHFINLLAPFHQIRMEDKEVIFEDQEEFSPFRRFLIRGLYGIIEFDQQIAFVFRNHIIFLNKNSKDMWVHMRHLQEKKNIFQRLFSS